MSHIVMTLRNARQLKHRIIGHFSALLVGLGLLMPNHAWAVLPIEQWQTTNGVKVLFMRADAIPMLDIAIRFDAGGRLDQYAGIGVASLTARLLDAGAATRNEVQLADAFALTGARRSAGAGDDSASVSLRTVLTEPELGQALALFGDMLAQPRFEQAAVEREKQRAVQSIRNGFARGAVVARRALYDLAYRDHPYGYQAREADIERINANKLRNFHRDYYVQSRATVAMIGAVSRERAREIAEQLMARLPASGKNPAPLAPVKPLAAPIEKRIKHPGTQSHILVGTPFLARGDPDYYALLLANKVLGGSGFVSRLYKAVREERGLTYGVSSGFSLAAQPGLFTVSLQTRREATGQALQVVRDELARFVRDGPTESELEAARSNLVGGFVFRIDANSKILRLMSAIGFHGLGLDYLDRWVDRINTVTLDEVRDALRRRLDPETLVTVVAGETNF